MLAALKEYIFTTPYYLLITIICFVLLVGVRTDTWQRSLAFLTGLVVLLIWFYWQYTPSGFDLTAFMFNADLKLAGVDVFGKDRPSFNVPGKEFTESVFLDYTPLEFAYFSLAPRICNLAYVATNRYWGWAVLHLIGLLFLVTAVAFYHRNKSGMMWQTLSTKAILILMSPWMWAYTYLLNWSDKAAYLSFSILLLAFWDNWLVASLAIGLSIGYNAGLILMAPAYLLYLWRQNGFAKALSAGSVMGLIVAGSALLYGTDGLVLFQNRSFRVHHYEPAYMSLFVFLPDGLYSPELLYITQIAMGLVACYLAYKGERRWAVILAVWGVLLLSPWNSHTRIIIACMLVILSQPSTSLAYYLLQAFLMMGFTFITRDPLTLQTTLLGNAVIALVTMADIIYTRRYSRLDQWSISAPLR